MIRYLKPAEVQHLHRRLIAESSGSHGLRNAGGLGSALAQPRASFGGQDLYPGLIEKAAASAFSLISNHPFIDGNKRIGHLAMEAFLLRHGHEIEASVDEQEFIIVSVAVGQTDRDALAGDESSRARGLTDLSELFRDIAHPSVFACVRFTPATESPTVCPTGGECSSILFAIVYHTWIPPKRPITSVSS